MGSHARAVIDGAVKWQIILGGGEVFACCPPPGLLACLSSQAWDTGMHSLYTHSNYALELQKIPTYTSDFPLY